MTKPKDLITIKDLAAELSIDRSACLRAVKKAGLPITYCHPKSARGLRTAALTPSNAEKFKQWRLEREAGGAATPVTSKVDQLIDPADEPIPDLVTRLYPGYERPDHLMPIIEVLERALVEEVRVVISTPPQHGMTSILQATLVKFFSEVSTLEPTSIRRIHRLQFDARKVS